MEELRGGRISTPVSFALRAITVGAGVPRTGWLHVVQAAIPANSVLSLSEAELVTAVSDHPLPQANATFFTYLVRAGDIVFNSGIFLHGLLGILGQCLGVSRSDCLTLRSYF